MFNSSVLDVVIGLVFLFMTVSLAASALTEAIGSLAKLRQGTLRSGIQALLNDRNFTGLAKDLYNHALINPLSNGTAIGINSLTTSPAYIQASSFAQALVSILERRDQSKPLADIVQEIPDLQLRNTLSVLLQDAKGDRDAFVAAVGAWFDDAMDRLSGWYKRYTQAIGFAVALLVCVVLNADAIRVGRTLWQTPSLRAELSVTSMPTPQAAIDTLTHSSLLGWTGTEAFDPKAEPVKLFEMLPGWFLVAFASLFGAPFWFDTLQRIVQLAGTGPSTATKPKAD